MSARFDGQNGSISSPADITGEVGGSIPTQSIHSFFRIFGPALSKRGHILDWGGFPHILHPMQTETRPPIETITSSAALRRWYWTKAELEAECRRRGLKITGAKFTQLDRIAHFLDTGETRLPGDTQPRSTSRFDWHSEPLTPETVITDSYRNSQNVRRFFKSEVGAQFKFNRAFMAWIKANTGKTLSDAVAEYHRLTAAAKAPGAQSDIAHHNQFNQYTRDFLADNPDMGMPEVRHFWALKRSLPSEDGRHRYDRSDLDLKA